MNDHPPISDPSQSISPLSVAAHNSPILGPTQAIADETNGVRAVVGIQGSTVDALKKYDTVVSSGQAALRALFTLNGGATIAFLTFLGHLWDNSTLPPSGGGVVPLSGGDALILALKLFIYGSFFAVVAYGTIFLTNCASSIEWKHARWKTIRKWLFGITVVLGVASLVCFLAASWQAVDGFESVRPK